uniref:Peptidase S54 rhomboid domain-containing protein n=1 Tax=Plectus sambesii TaxID=2011161 RepID=A0A914VWW8_9BILA
MPQNRRQGSNYGVILLLYTLFANNDYLPPVTLGAIVLQVAIYLGFIPPLDPSNTYQLCVQPSRILNKGEWWRLLAPTLMHGDDMHLYFNMVSLLWKGRRLERHLGSKRFLLTLVIFSVLTSLTMVGMSVGIEEYAGMRSWNLMQQCAVGFSAIDLRRARGKCHQHVRGGMR